MIIFILMQASLLLKLMNNNRIILHIDMDSFFASIEMRDKPDLIGKPVIVGANPKGGKGEIDLFYRSLPKQDCSKDSFRF
jgi:hypothetical protein